MTSELHEMTGMTSTEPNRSTNSEGGKVSESRREYLRAYYRRNREKSRQYQREYNLRHKKKLHPTAAAMREARSAYKLAIHASDIMHASPERAAQIINQVVKGDRQMVAVARPKVI